MRLPLIAWLVAISQSAVLVAGEHWLFAASSRSSWPAPACVTFRGAYEGTDVYRFDQEQCGGSQDWLDTLDEGHLVPSPQLESGWIMMHVQQARVEAATVMGSEEWLGSLQNHIKATATAIELEHEQSSRQTAQRVLTQDAGTRWQLHATPPALPLLMHASSGNVHPSAFFAIPASTLPFVDLLFPPSAVLVSVPDMPVPRVPQNHLMLSNSNQTKVPLWLSDALKKVHYSPLVDAILQDVNVDTLQRDVRHLTAEDGHFDWTTRHSFTSGGHAAAHWIKKTVEKEAGVQCCLHEHTYGFNPNVLCTFRGVEQPDELVILGAHYDNRGTFGFVRAPGADDDASGVSALLSLARIFKAYNVQFSRTVVLAFFSGEEQGLVGSRAYAKSLKDQDTAVRFMLQADMIGYRNEGEQMQLALPDRYDTIEARWLVGNLSLTYVPQLQVGTTPACCSDHQSFDQQGFVSTWVFERNGPIADPKYHNSQDLSERPGYDYEQIAAIARVMLATVLVVADFNL